MGSSDVIRKEESQEEDAPLMKDDEEHLKLDLENQEPQGEKVSWFAMVMNLTAAGLGTGILSMPKNMAASGVINAGIITALLMVLQYYTMMLLVKASDKYQIFDLESLLMKVPGGIYWYWTSTVATWVNFGLVLLSYLLTFTESSVTLERLLRQGEVDMTVKQVVQSLESGADTLSSAYKSFGTLSKHAAVLEGAHEQVFVSAYAALAAGYAMPYLWLAVGTILVFGLSQLSQKALGVTSGITVVINIGLVVVILVNFFSDGFSTDGSWAKSGDICWFGLSTGNVSFLSNFLMAACIHPCIPPMYEELEGRTPERFSSALIVSNVLLFFLFMGVSGAGYFTYGESVGANILFDLPSRTMFQRFYNYASQFGILFVVASCYPLQLIPMLTVFKSGASRFVGGSVVTGVACAGALFCYVTGVSIDVVGNISGALSAFFFLCLFPAVISWFMLGSNESFGGKLGMSVLSLFGLVAMLLGLLYNDPTPEFKQFRTPVVAADLAERETTVWHPHSAEILSSSSSAGVAPPKELHDLLSVGNKDGVQGALTSMTHSASKPHFTHSLLDEVRRAAGKPAEEPLPAPVFQWAQQVDQQTQQNSQRVMSEAEYFEGFVDRAKDGLFTESEYKLIAPALAKLQRGEKVPSKAALEEYVSTLYKRYVLTHDPSDTCTWRNGGEMSWSKYLGVTKDEPGITLAPAPKLPPQQ